MTDLKEFDPFVAVETAFKDDDGFPVFLKVAKSASLSLAAHLDEWAADRESATVFIHKSGNILCTGETLRMILERERTRPGWIPDVVLQVSR